MTTEAPAPGPSWSLECVGGGQRGWEVPLRPGRFRVGREGGLDLTLHSVSISKVHAEVLDEGGVLSVRDLGSRNGTFVNGEPVSASPLLHGDLVRFADVEFRVVAGTSRRPSRAGSTGPLAVHLPPAQLVEAVRALVHERAVRAVFQPIRELHGGALVGLEALGRGTSAAAPSLPAELFELAGWAGLQAELSRVMRRRAAEEAAERPGAGLLFLNTHPAESDRATLLESLAELPRTGRQLVLELHERTLSDAMGRLKGDLSRLDVGLAFDDFGAGQARLIELAEAPPHFLKFDMCFIRGLESASPSRRRLLASLVGLANELGTHTVAEGVETAQEAGACREIGFRSAQGYWLGRPLPIAELKL